jgi:hypothetical protein
MEKGQATLAEMIGWKYSLLELPLQLMDGILHKLWRRPRTGWDAYVFRKLSGIWKRGVICSQTTCRVDIAVGWKPGHLKYASPDDALDYELLSPDWDVTDHSDGFFDV